MAAIDRRSLIVFTRYPEPGQAKTRLIPRLGANGAARLQEQMTRHTLRAAQELGVRTEVRFEGGDEQQMSNRFGEQHEYIPQGEGDLGQRMSRAIADRHRAGMDSILTIGTDCPAVDALLLTEAFEQLRNHDIVLGPAHDGGYYLIGTRCRTDAPFRGVDWGTDRVLKQTVTICESLGMRVAMLRPLSDVDRPEDLEQWETYAPAASLSVIVPTLNEEAHIAATLQRIMEAENVEVIVVDGGSRDRTVAIAQELGAKVLVTGPGRAIQMNAGVAASRSAHLLFCHADTLLPQGYEKIVQSQLASESVAIGAFTLQIDGEDRRLRKIERSVRFRSRRLKLPYGDQALFLRRSTFEKLRGYSAMATMEDFDLARRAGRMGLVVTVDDAVVTSGRLWQRRGYFWPTLVHQIMVIGY